MKLLSSILSASLLSIQAPVATVSTKGLRLSKGGKVGPNPDIAIAETANSLINIVDNCPTEVAQFESYHGDTAALTECVNCAYG